MTGVKRNSLTDKYNRLVSQLHDLGKVAIAYSGGVDSTFLLAVSSFVLKDKALGITIDSPALPRYELEDAISNARAMNARHIIINSPDIEEEVRLNPVNRCYYCKKAEFGLIVEEAGKNGIRHVLDGSNTDDLNDYRPGRKAMGELNIISPLIDNNLDKSEIRELSRNLNLATWNKPAHACLFSRIPYGKEINQDDLRKIEQSERFLIKKGFKNVRVRCHDNLARIEIDRSDLGILIEEKLSQEVYSKLQEFGFQYVSVDLLGYRMGSLNIEKKYKNLNSHSSK